MSTQAAITANLCRKHHLAMADMILPVLTDVTASIVRDRGQACRRPGVVSFTYRDRGRASGWLPRSQVPPLATFRSVGGRAGHRQRSARAGRRERIVAVGVHGA